MLPNELKPDDMAACAAADTLDELHGCAGRADRSMDSSKVQEARPDARPADKVEADEEFGLTGSEGDGQSCNLKHESALMVAKRRPNSDGPNARSRKLPLASVKQARWCHLSLLSCDQMRAVPSVDAVANNELRTNVSALGTRESRRETYSHSLMPKTTLNAGASKRKDSAASQPSAFELS